MIPFFRRKKPDAAAPAAPAATEPAPQTDAPQDAGTAGSGALRADHADHADPVSPAVDADFAARYGIPVTIDRAPVDPSPTPAPAPASAPASVPAPAPTVDEPLEPAQAEAPATVVVEPMASAVEPAAPAFAQDVPGVATDAAPAAAAGKPGWRERLRNSAFARSFGGLFSRNPKLDDDLLDEIETALLTADVGVTATTQLVESLRRRMKSREFADARALLAALRADLIALLAPVAKPLAITPDKPFVILTVGVNGVGKTTTIGKLAHRFKAEGRSLMLAAGDTFRAAAVAQLQAWGERNGVAVVAQGQNADAASVAFDALQAAKARGTDVLIADTAGRLHTQQGLMAELGKIRRVLGKLDGTAPHEVLMVIDGTTGQNALSQLREFNAAAGVTGLVVTKLDGTAKGGVVFALAREFGIPIRFAGIGERPEDLRVFDPEAFVDALLPEALGA
ncbi:MAG: signal recognition particle-docking protein FtsY [Lysobacteraceae bacterium]